MKDAKVIDLNQPLGASNMFVRKPLLVYLLIVAVLLSTACESEVLVTKVDPTKPGTQRTSGVLFSLPRTVVIAEIPLTKTSLSPGNFARWTPFFYPELTTDDFITEEKTTFKIGAPTFTTRGQTDPNQVYIAHIKAKLFETKTLLLEMSEDGIIARAEATSKDDTIDIITSSIKTATSFVAPLLPVGFGANESGVTTALVAGASLEDSFKQELTPQELALYESLDPSYKTFLRNHFGFRFLLYIATKESIAGTVKPANIDLFLTLNQKQRDFIIALPHSAAPCDGGDPGSTCLDPDVLRDLVRAKQAYDAILELRRKRENILAEATPPQVTNSANLEFRLKEIDTQIRTTEQTYFLGSPAETSATARFEFTPTTAIPTQSLFTYAGGGPRPGICTVSPETAGVFKAIWPRSLRGDCHAANHFIQTGDLRDAKGFIRRLRVRAATDLVSIFLYNQFPMGLQNAINGSSDTDTPQVREQLLNQLLPQLQTIINGLNIYSAGTFAGVRLSASTLDLQAELARLQAMPAPLPPADAARLVSIVAQINRALLDDAYTAELFRQSSWTSRAVDLAVNLPANGSAGTITTANLIETGKRSFPYRVSAPGIARVSDGGTERGQGELRIAQFGPVQTLPAATGGRRTSYKITYHDATGAIKTFDMASDALIQQKNVTDITDAATNLRDAEAARLKRETELLELRKKKLEAEKALKEAQGEPSPSPTPQP
jgi:hypothetical protein